MSPQPPFWQISSASGITVTDTDRSVTAFAPASVSNVACGFDVMGFALEGLGDEVTVTLIPNPGITVSVLNQQGSPLPLDPLRNTAGPPVAALLKKTGTTYGIEILIRKGLAPGSGLGSSAASAAAAATACNALLEAGFSPRELLPYALEGEKVASGAVHADNVAPALLGGFTIVRGYNPLDVVRLSPPGELWCAIVLPSGEIETRTSRSLLPSHIPLQDVVTQTGNAAGLIAGLLTADYSLIGRSLQDVIAEPARAHTIKGFAAMKKAALDAGALGCSISGSGPALFALTVGEDACRRAAKAMGDALAPFGVACSTFSSRVNSHGAVITSRKRHASV
jgi:homoserine kinase